MSMDTERFQRWANDFGWFHQGLGVLGGLSFFIGSILFLWKDPLQLIGVWLFIIGSFGMLIGNVGTFFFQLERTKDSERCRERQHDVATSSRRILPGISRQNIGGLLVGTKRFIHQTMTLIVHVVKGGKS